MQQCFPLLWSGGLVQRSWAHQDARTVPSCREASVPLVNCGRAADGPGFCVEARLHHEGKEHE